MKENNKEIECGLKLQLVNNLSFGSEKKRITFSLKLMNSN